MRTLYAVIIWVCMIVVIAEIDNMVAFVVSKVIAGVLIAVFGKLFVKTMTDEEMNEKV